MIPPDPPAAPWSLLASNSLLASSAPDEGDEDSEEDSEEEDEELLRPAASPSPSDAADF